jgi:hypothetical protein
MFTYYVPVWSRMVLCLLEGVGRLREFLWEEVRVP